ncbi:MAG: EthD family reductase [Gammaproteobacteria bacterium]
MAGMTAGWALLEEDAVADIELMVMYPCPHDIRAFEKLYEDEDMPMRDGLSSEYAMSFETFEKLYHEEHVPMIVEKLVGKTRFVATKVVATPDGTPPPFYRIAEIHFPSLDALQTCAPSAGGKKPLPMPTKSRMAARRPSCSPKNKRSFLAAVPFGID